MLDQYFSILKTNSELIVRLMRDYYVTCNKRGRE